MIFAKCELESFVTDPGLRFGADWINLHKSDIFVADMCDTEPDKI